MARLLLLAGLVGAPVACSVPSAEDLLLIQTWKTVPAISSDEEGRELFTHAGASTPWRESFTHAGVSIYPRMDDGERDAKSERSWMLVLKSDATEAELQALLQELHPTALKTNPAKGEIPVVEGRLTVEGLQALLERHPGRFKYVEEDLYERKIWESLEKNDGPMDRRAYPWGIQSINAHVHRGRGAGVNVYVLDTGIRTTHILFGGRAFAGVDVGTTGTLEVCAPSSTTCAADNNGHGTHCAGTVGASLYGVADGATIWGMKVLDDSGNGFISWAVLAQQWVLSSGSRPAVVSMSLGAEGASNTEQLSIDALVADGVVVVAAGGNQNLDACDYSPGNIPSAITVASYGGASGSSSDMSPFSNYGACIDVWAPGTYILSAHHLGDDALAHGSGTSMAAPHVAGLAAVMFEAYPSAGSMTASQRWDLMTASNRTGWVTGIPAAAGSRGTASIAETVNLVALAPTPTASPTPLPTPSPTPAAPAPPLLGGVSVAAPAAPATGGVSGVGDPHLANMLGERFDLYRTGVSVLLQIPRWAGPRQTLLLLEADTRRMGSCSDVYFQVVNISGTWTNRSGGLEFFASQGGKPSSMAWTRFGRIDLKVVNGKTREGIAYLNVFARNLGSAGHAVGGLLGEDDHGDASTPPEACKRHMSLLAGGSSGEAPSAASVAEGTFA